MKRLYTKKGENPLNKEHLKRRLLNGIIINLENGCWEWRRSRNQYGYGTLTLVGKTVLAHRLSFELFIGDIPEGQFVLHECDNPSCINPSHLHLGSQSDNMKECYIRGRTRGCCVGPPIRLCGERNGQAKLTKTDVERIRELLATGLAQRKIATKYGVSQSQISNIKRGLRWV